MEKKKSMKAALLALVAVPCALVLTACGGGAKAVWKSDFTSGNNNAFTNLYGEVTYNEEAKTVTINRNADNQGANTYYGEEDKNTDWQKGGLTSTAKFNIVASSMAEGEGFNWSVALNNQEGTYLAERSIYFRKYAEGIKVGYTYNGSSDGINATATSDESAVLLADGWYNVKFNFHAVNNEVKVTISVVNKDNDTVFTTANAKLNHNDDSAVLESEVKGIRYGWVSWMSAPTLECSEVAVYKN